MPPEDKMSTLQSNVTQIAVQSLSQRELVVLRELGTGASLEVIAARLFVSRNTVKSQAISIYRKLGASTRHDAVVRGRERLHGSVT